MRLAISNIAWDVSEDSEVAVVLQRYAVDAIDIAPGKYFRQPAEATDTEILNVRNWWLNHGIEITGMQALLFGTTGLNVFGSSETQATMLRHLRAVCRIGGVLGATRLVFGSPKNRDRGGLNDIQANEIASNFFYRLGDIACAEGVAVCLEPNPECYGANFLTTSSETAVFVKTLDHASIRMQLDTGAIAINHESPQAIMKMSANLIGHVHASEPDLVTLGEGGTDHATVYNALSDYLPNSVVSIEMLATQNEPHLSAIQRALAVASRYYRPLPGVHS